MKKTLREYFEDNVKSKPKGECWEWTGSINLSKGYGRVHFDGKTIAAHRVSWMLYRGSLDHRDRVHHSCDNPQCVNPFHLFIGGTRLEKDCEICGKTFKYRRDHVTRARFCSRRCANENAINSYWAKKKTKWSNETEEETRLIMQASFEKFFEKTDGCWKWSGAARSRKKSYGVFYFRAKSYGAHRASWIVYCGEIPKGMFVCHTCDNPRCVNPEHLFLGTAMDNTKDMVDKCRANKRRGKDGRYLK